MNYELALQMKEAGFTFKDTDGKIYHLPVQCLMIDGKWYFETTLEEVIDALPIKISTDKRFTNDEHKVERAHSLSFHLSTIHESKTDFKWYAGLSHSSLPDTCHILKTGATPLEAVCRLWMVLNKHD